MRQRDEHGRVRYGPLVAVLAMMLFCCGLVHKLLADTYTQTGINNLMISNTDGAISVPALNIRPIASDLTNGQVGDIWFNSATSGFRMQTGASTVVGMGALVKSIIVADGTAVTNPTSAVSFSSVFAFPANSLVAGNRIRMHATGKYSSGSSPSLVKFTGELGPSGQALAATANITTGASASSLAFTVDQDVIIRTAGSSGTMVANIDGKFDVPGTVTGIASHIGRLGSTAINTTVANNFALEILGASSDASGSYTLEQFDVYVDN